ncbi:hypothetical protein BDQ12DRAFT_593498 [Crucibulum laeve]|uniref:Arrestin C-terminal-like domain-containing protein n=1 Tax=Crucibulum laeve TaxID=68775 RepID=A0A5C3MGV6_9AGAR|nr:hypothetical protein BDQ12DRAFT_593498 [Crucibulum laeve]
MAFVLTPLTRPPSPTHRPHIPHHEDEGQNSASLPRVASAPQLSEMGREKERSHLEIHLDNQFIQLKGTGPDVEPTRLSGHVALVLTEPTSLKEVTLTFRGKARIPVPASESVINSGSSLTYIVCNHEWSFLEGDKKHSRTLKAGRHYFPFQLQIGGSLPSSIVTPSFGGASVVYKLRAQATRPGLMANNLQAIEPVHILRSFANEALEYQQTMEIENTWPEKIMYSILVPHKAWAAGDRLTALVKFSPLAKGVAVLSVTTTIHEATKVYARSGAQEDTRVIATAKHDIEHGHAVEVEPDRPRHSGVSTPASSPGSTAVTSSSSHRDHSRSEVALSSGPNSHHATPSSSSSSLPQAINNAIAGPSTSTATVPHSPSPDDDYYRENNDVVTHLSITIPPTATPTHALEPIAVTHRIRWSILILNMDGHTSELRCSLPLHVLDHSLLDEARAYTSATRRLVMGMDMEEVSQQEEEDRELPSYTAHVRDRVANMFLPEAATMRVINPWVATGTSPTHEPQYDPLGSWPHSRGRSGHSTPLEAHLFSHLPHAPGSGDTTPLDWVNSELLLSLSSDPPPTLRRDSRRSVELHHTPPEACPQASGSSPHSRRNSRPSSRASSPERHSFTGSGSSIHQPPASAPVTPAVAGPDGAYVHNGHASRNLHSLLKATMKPFTSLTHPLGHHHGGLFSRHQSGSPHHHPAAPSANGTASPSPLAHMGTGPIAQQVPRSLTLPPTPEATEQSGSALLHRAFTEVPDYNLASRGFIGGVPPLTSMRGLPSYEEAAASREGETMRATQSEADLTNRFASLQMNPGEGVVEQDVNDNDPRAHHSLSMSDVEGLMHHDRPGSSEGSSEGSVDLPPPVAGASALFHI